MALAVRGLPRVEMSEMENMPQGAAGYAGSGTRLACGMKRTEYDVVGIRPRHEDIDMSGARRGRSG